METQTDKEPRAAGRAAKKNRSSMPDSLRVTRKGGHVQGKQKNAAVQRLLQGEDIWTLSNELGVTVGRLMYWKEIYGPDDTEQDIQPVKDDVVRILKRELELQRRKNEELRSEMRRLRSSA